MKMRFDGIIGGVVIDEIVGVVWNSGQFLPARNGFDATPDHPHNFSLDLVFSFGQHHKLSHLKHNFF